MDSESDKESLEGDINASENEQSNWGKTKYDYYYTDYVDKDYPSKLTAKEEKLANIEQEEALRIQRKLLLTLEDVDLQITYEETACSDNDNQEQEDIIKSIENHNRSLENPSTEGSRKRKRVTFEGEGIAAKKDDEDSDDIVDDDDDDEDGEAEESEDDEEKGRQRRPINVAIKKNRGLTPYKKKEYRNPRVKHKLKYKKAMSKRRRNIKEVQTEFHRYSGETTGIKTGTVKSIKLC